MHHLIEKDPRPSDHFPKPLNVIDVYIFIHFQGNAIRTSTQESTRSYFFQLPLKQHLNVFILFDVHFQVKLIKFKFKPTQLIPLNTSLNITSIKAITDLTNHFSFLHRSSKFHGFKWYFDQKGFINLELFYAEPQQFLELQNVSYILGIILNKVSDLLNEMLPQMLTYLNLESFLKVEPSKVSEPEDDVLTIEEKFKYMALLNKVYKSHRVISQTQAQNKASDESLFPKNETFLKTNILVQQDTYFIEQTERQRQKYDAKFKPVFELLLSRKEDKEDYLKMPKMSKVQSEFQEYLTSIKKENLQIDEMSNNEYRILKGIQNYQVINPPKVLSKNGAHSIIFLGNPFLKSGRYKLHLSDTLFSYQHQEMNQYQKESRQIEESLITKKIGKAQSKASVNSFQNQVDFLFHVKDKRSKYVATYFLPVDKEKQEIEQIFSRHYKCNLKEYLQSKRESVKSQIDLFEAIKIAENILFSLIFLVENMVLHRDLKPENLVMDENEKTRLIDFGSCSSIIYSKEFEYQTKYFDCAESIRKKYTKEEYERHYMYDLHSFGETLREIVSYCNLDSEKSRFKVNIGETIEMMVSLCKDQDPMERVTYDELLFYIKLLKELLVSS